MKQILFAMLFVCGAINAQVVVNGIDLNEKVTAIEVYTVAKLFNTKESIFVNSGINDFKKSGYDNSRQSVHDAKGKKFEKGEYLKLYNYLIEQGWEEGSSRDVRVLDEPGTMTIFKRKKV